MSHARPPEGARTAGQQAEGTPVRRIRFATLGPAGSNHELVVARYLEFHGLTGRAVTSLHASFEEAVHRVLAGDADFLVQCAVHPATPETVAQYFRGLYLVDTFISPSRDLAVIRRKDCPAPATVGAMAATTSYADLSRWGTVQPTETVAAVTRGLLDGRFDAGLAFATLADEYPERFCIDHHVESVDDAWLVYGRKRVSNGALVACANSAAARLFNEP